MYVRFCSLRNRCLTSPQLTASSNRFKIQEAGLIAIVAAKKKHLTMGKKKKRNRRGKLRQAFGQRKNVMGKYFKF